MSHSHAVANGYRFFAPFYDAVFGAILQPGRRQAIAQLNLAPGARVLEVGVGTGLSLDLYPKGTRVTGIDLSPEMLAKARARTEREEIEQVEDLLEMDAQEMRFPDHSFDAVLAMYVVAVVPDPVKVIEEMRRVCKPGGTLVIVNRFGDDNALMGTAEWLLKPLHRILSHRPDMDLAELVTASRLDVTAQSRANVFRYSTILTCRSEPAQ